MKANRRSRYAGGKKKHSSMDIFGSSGGSCSRGSSGRTLVPESMEKKITPVCYLQHI